jgi:phosphoglycerol transferase MdoB-like AlkP superfamily enzyme
MHGANGFWHQAYRCYRPLLIFSATILITLTGSRLGLIAAFSDRVMATGGLWYVLLQGVRFDILILCTLMTPLLLVQPFLCANRFWQNCLRVYLIAAYGLVVLVEAATPTFIGEFDLRPNMLFIEYLRYPREILSMLWIGYKIPVFLGVGTSCALVLMLTRLLRQPQLPPGLPLGTGLLFITLSLLLAVVGIRSSFGHRPANPSVIAFSNDLLVNDLVLSSVYSIGYAAYSSAKHESGVRDYKSMPFAEMIDYVKADMHLPDSHFIDPALPTLHKPYKPHSRAKKPNLVIVLEESLGAEFVGSLGGLDLTPNLDDYSKRGIWFTHLYATGTRSVRGIEAVMTGFTPTPARSVVKLPKSQTGFFTIAEILKRNGYETSFIYGGEAHFDNMRQFLVGNGIERVIEEKDFAHPAFKGSWGVSDEDLFQRAHATFEEMEDVPFFSLVFTSSNHSPFEFPDDKISLNSQPKQQVNNAVKYADYALGEFLRMAEASSYWDNTIFLVVADHNSRVWGNDLVPIERFHIPALLLGGGITPRTYDRLASQIDLLPTLLGLLGIDTPHPAIGLDLFRDDIEQIPGRAVMQYDKTQAYMQDNHVVVMKLGQEPLLYDRTASGLAPAAEEDPQLINRAAALASWSSYAYQNRVYHLAE